MYTAIPLDAPQGPCVAPMAREPVSAFGITLPATERMVPADPLCHNDCGTVRVFLKDQSMETIRKEFRLAIRRLLHARLVTLLALATLALGIGANSAIFTVVNAILIRPLPFEDPERMVTVQRLKDGLPSAVSAPAFMMLRERLK